MIISLMGTFGEANVGDDLLLISTIYELRAKNEIISEGESFAESSQASLLLVFLSNRHFLS